MTCTGVSARMYENETRDGGEVEGEREQENDLAFLACLLCLPMPQTTPRDIYSTRRGSTRL